MWKCRRNISGCLSINVIAQSKETKATPAEGPNGRLPERLRMADADHPGCWELMLGREACIDQ